MGERYLVLIDVDQIQSYVFATHRLREIRGASALLSQVESEVKQLIETGGSSAGVVWLTPGGGTLRAVVTCNNEEAAKALAEKAAGLYLARTSFATATGCACKIDAGEEVGQALNRAEVELRRKKSAEVREPWSPSHPLFRFCRLCGQAPAMNLADYLPPGEKQWLLCDACLAKSKMASQINRGQMIGPENVAQKACQAAARKNGNSIEFIPPDDFGGLVTRRKSTGENVSADTNRRSEEAERRYMGVIYADVNGMGQKWRELCDRNTPEKDLKDISDFIASGTEESLIEAVATTCQNHWQGEQKRQPGTGKRILPFIPLIVGGDDVICVVPAAWALEVALSLCNNFTEILKNYFACVNMSCPAMSAGVVICKSKFPILQAMDLTKQLLREAKRRCRETANEDPGAIDFAVISESGSQSLTKIRQAGYEIRGLGLTERPYLVNPVNHCGDLPLQALLQAAQVMRQAQGESKVPRGKWKKLATLLRIDDQSLRDHEYLEFVAGLTDAQRQTWAQACAKLQLPINDVRCADTYSYQRDVSIVGGQLRRSGLLDLIEVLDILDKG